MLRWIGRKICLCLVLLSLFYYLNERHPAWLQTFGRWVGGEVGNRVSVTVSHILEEIKEGIDLGEVVEVFREEN